jgi:uncharacterized repeat protein (TIGR01451 family)
MVKTLFKMASGLSVLAVLALSAPASAGGTYPGQIEGGNIYRIKNITKNVDFTDPAVADACDVLMYKVRIHNPGPSPLTNVNVKATLPGGAATSHTSTATVTASDAMPASTSDSATVNLSSSQSLSYVGSSTELLDANDGFIKNLPDGVTSGGVSIGNVGVSINEKRFVQFKVKVSCPQPPKVEFACKALDVNKVSRTRFDFTAHASASNATVQSYVFTAKDADGNVVDTETVATSALSAGYTLNQDKPGKYTVSVVVKTDKGDAAVDHCVQTVTVEEEETPPTTPPVVEGKTTELPNTGAGAVVGLFAGVSALATAGHFAFRRFIG